MGIAPNYAYVRYTQDSVHEIFNIKNIKNLKAKMIQDFQKDASYHVFWEDDHDKKSLRIL